MKFTIKDRITTAEPNAVLSYALDYRAEFEVDDEWADKVITARFVHSNGEYIDVVLDNFGCNIPLFPKGVLWVGAYTDEFTSTAVPVPIGVTIKDLGEHEAIPPTADVYQQIIALIEAGRLKGDKGDPGEDYTITESDYQAIADRVPQPDLSEYVKNTDYATESKGGAVKVTYSRNFVLGTDGTPRASVKTASAYETMPNDSFIGKGTLENVLNERMKEPQFELIEEITLTEDVESITRTAEPNGTPYNFKAMYITALFNSASTNIRVVISDIRGNNWNTPRVSTISAKTRYNCIANCHDVCYDAQSNVGSSAATSVIGEFNKFITKMVLRSENAVLPSGTTIKIYGIRA